MKRRVLGFLLVTALLLGVSTIAAACGGGEEELSLEEYFQKLQTISNDIKEREEGLDTEFEMAFDPETSPETTIDIVESVLSQGASASKAAFDDVDSLDPPSEVEDAHNEFLREGRARTELLESLADQAAKVESLPGLEDMFAEFDSPDLEVAAVRFDDACRALEQVAADNDIEVDLNCE
jgi:hypothetical protein